MRLLAAGAALVVGLAGCGDDGPSKDEFIADGDQLCRELRRDLDAVELPDPTAKLPDLSAYIDEVEPIVERGRDQVAELEAPEDAEDLKADLLSSLDDQIAKLADVREKAEANDAEGTAEALQSLEERSDEIDARVQEYGFQDCGRAD